MQKCSVLCDFERSLALFAVALCTTLYILLCLLDKAVSWSVLRFEVKLLKMQRGR